MMLQDIRIFNDNAGNRKLQFYDGYAWVDVPEEYEEGFFDGTGFGIVQTENQKRL